MIGTRRIVLAIAWSPRIFQNGVLLRRNSTRASKGECSSCPTSGLAWPDGHEMTTVPEHTT